MWWGMREFLEATRREHTLIHETYIAPRTQRTHYFKGCLDKYFKDGRFTSPNNFELNKVHLLPCNYSEDETVALLNNSLVVLSVGNEELLSVPVSQIICRGYTFPHKTMIGSMDLLQCEIIWDITRLYKELFTRLELSGTLFSQSNV